MNIKVQFIEKNIFPVHFDDGSECLDIDFGEVFEPDAYKGPYTVDPSAYCEIILPTKGKSMSDNVVVNKIYSAAVSNPSGGNTFYIASSLDE